MSQATPFQPDQDYCALCHAPASGPCAVCRALICSDCAELSGGSVKTVAVCYQCAQKGRGQVGVSQWWRLLWPIIAGLLVLAVLAWVVVGRR